MKINYGLSGLGGIAKIHLMGLNNMKLVGIDAGFDVNLAGLHTTSEEHRREGIALGFESVADDIDELLKMEKIDLVDICTPNFLHKDQIIKTVRAKKNVYCEKPLGMNSDETAEVLEEARNSGVKNQVAFMLRFVPAVAKAHSIISQGLLGEVYAFRGEFFHSSYLNAEKPFSWRLDFEKSGGGALADLGVHMIDLVRFILGEFESVDAKVKTIVKKRKSPDGNVVDVTVDDWALIFAKLQSGAHGTVEASKTAVGKDGTRLEIYAQRGALFVDLENPYDLKVFGSDSKRVYFDEALLSNDAFYKEVADVYPNPKLSQGYMVDAHMTSLVFFMKSIMGETVDGLPTFEDGHRAQIVLDEAYGKAD